MCHCERCERERKGGDPLYACTCPQEGCTSWLPLDPELDGCVLARALFPRPRPGKATALEELQPSLTPVPISIPSQCIEGHKAPSETVDEACEVVRLAEKLLADKDVAGLRALLPRLDMLDRHAAVRHAAANAFVDDAIARQDFDEVGGGGNLGVDKCRAQGRTDGRTPWLPALPALNPAALPIFPQALANAVESVFIYGLKDTLVDDTVRAINFYRLGKLAELQGHDARADSALAEAVRCLTACYGSDHALTIEASAMCDAVRARLRGARTPAAPPVTAATTMLEA